MREKKLGLATGTAYYVLGYKSLLQKVAKLGIKLFAQLAKI